MKTGKAVSRVISAAVSTLLLAACGSREPVPAEPNGAVGADADGPSSSAGPGQAEGPANLAEEPVGPPDAVSHPDGFLPPAPGEEPPPGVNSSGPEESPPATEDEYIRNRQSGR